VTARGDERKDSFRDDTHRFHFLELLSELGARFEVRVHAYVLMDNHYHLLVETPEANLFPFRENPARRRGDEYQRGLSAAKRLARRSFGRVIFSITPKASARRSGGMAANCSAA
jgi:REP element-mobilizing transposase RayT